MCRTESMIVVEFLSGAFSIGFLDMEFLGEYLGAALHMFSIAGLAPRCRWELACSHALPLCRGSLRLESSDVV